MKIGDKVKAKPGVLDDKTVLGKDYSKAIAIYQNKIGIIETFTVGDKATVAHVRFSNGSYILFRADELELA